MQVPFPPIRLVRFGRLSGRGRPRSDPSPVLEASGRSIVWPGTPPLHSTPPFPRTALTTSNPSDTIPIGNIPLWPAHIPAAAAAWPAAYFINIPSGTWRPPDDEEGKQLARLREAGGLRRTRRLANALIEGAPVRERRTST